MRLRAGLTIAALTLGFGASGAHAGPAYQGPRNALGQPDFEGVWSMNSMTRLERPRNIPNLVLTPEQLKIPPAQILPSDGVGTAESDPTDSFQAGWARLGDEYRSSWIVDPGDGRLPYSEAGNKLAAFRGGSDNPESRSNYERCLTTPLSGPPMINSAYNNNIQFVQTRDTIAIAQESNHEVRLIHMDTRVHNPVPRWFGDSVGWWEGQTLVVETVGFTPSQNERRASTTRLVMSPKAKVTERFTRISKTQIKYEFTVEDPAVFTQVWRGELPLTATTEPTFEYACHEGNYGLEDILAGARYEEAERARK
ncbi:MAG TPA: hypothetical protein VFN88_09935 [Caulobacteraceae bacterium]|nr:hypothetical protein [Caulobacteraceae bacterium]